MASLTRGTSFRRQGSSGHTWTYNEEGILVRLNKEGQPHVFTAGGSLSRVHIWHDVENTNLPEQKAEKLQPSKSSAVGHGSASAQSILERSKSVGSAPNRFAQSNHTTITHATKSRSRVMKWIKKTIIKLKN